MVGINVFYRDVTDLIEIVNTGAFSDEARSNYDDVIEEGGTVRVGTCELSVIHLVGHTPGSITLAHTPADAVDRLFTGDGLFPGGVGRTRSDDDFDSLFGDVTTKLFDRFGDDTVVHPGHGADTTQGAERPQLDRWRARRW